MKVLFIDTHSEKVRIILKNGESIVKEEMTSDRSHSEVAVSTLEKVLNKAKLETDELDEIVVVNGPGSFTGVRIGVTIAKTIAYSKNIPIKTITSLEAFGCSATEIFDLVTVEDAKGVYSAVLKNGEYDDFLYQKRSEFEEYVNSNNFKVLKEKIMDLDKMLDYLSDKDCTNPHLVNPIYIKEIDALK